MRMSAVRGWPRSLFPKPLTDSFFKKHSIICFPVAMPGREAVKWIAKEQCAGEAWCAGDSSTAAFPQAKLVSSICSVPVAAGRDGP